MRREKAFLIGIKGVAMTSLAVYLQEKGYLVSGSDVEDVFPTDKILSKSKIKVLHGFSEKNISKDLDLVIVTGAHGGMTNPQAKKAINLKIPTFMHGEFLGRVMKNKFAISIAGCHGKTTTSSLIAYLLFKARLNPSFAIGTAEINNLGAGGHFGRSKIFVAEADEYMTCPYTDPTPRFLWQDPKILVITNIEFDHPDAYKNIDEVKNAYLRFIQKLSKESLIIVCIDNHNVADLLLLVKQQVITYGFSPRADFEIYRFYFTPDASFMRLKHKNIDLGEYMIQIPGRHNLLNSTAAIIVADQLSIRRETIKENLSQFTGCKRRFEKIGKFGKSFLYDDYAHHPSEIVATLSAAKTRFKTNRVIVIFQPHTFSRTKSLLSDFARSFQDADIALICDIYPSAREKSDHTINSQMLVVEANRYKKNSYYAKNKDKVLSFLNDNVKPGDIIITMGAGDIYLWHQDLKRLLQDKLE